MFRRRLCFFKVWNFTPKPERNHALKMKWPQFSLWTGNVNFQMMIMHHHSLSAELNNLGVIDAAALCSTPPLWTQMNDTEKRFFKDQKLQSFVEVTYPHETQHCLLNDGKCIIFKKMISIYKWHLPFFSDNDEKKGRELKNCMSQFFITRNFSSRFWFLEMSLHRSFFFFSVAIGSFVLIRFLHVANDSVSIKNGQLLLYVTISCINEVNLHPFSTPPQKIMHEVTKLKHNQKKFKNLIL